MTTHPLTDYREQIGLSQREVARRVGVSRWTINSIEVGRRLPSLSLIARLARISGGVLKADDFMPKDGAMVPLLTESVNSTNGFQR